MGRLLRRAGGGDAAGPAPPGFEDRLRQAGGGQAIPAEPRRHLEAGLGAELGGVRLHTGDRPAALSAQVDAHAFTVGQDIYLGRNDQDLDTRAGYHLLAHEVVHTLQPGTGPAASSLTVGAVHSPAEREAEDVATSLTERRFAATEHDVPSINAGSAGANRTIRRFGKFEHRDIGNTNDEKIDLGNGLVVDWGSVVSVAGDEYGTEEDLRKAVSTGPGRAKVREVMAGDDVHSADYVTLAMENVSHFSAGGTAALTWESHHESALVKALHAGLDDDNAEWEGAKLTEAFGQHFLTDMFSAGHVRTPRAEIIAWYGSDFAPRALTGFVNYLQKALDDSVTAGVLLGPLGTLAVDKAIEMVVDALRYKLEPPLGLGIGGAVSGTLHDRDNAAGLVVASEAHPQEWRTYGDGKLKCSQTTFDQAGLAVTTAFQDLVKARELGRLRREHGGVTIRRDMSTIVPTTVYFELNAEIVDATAAAALDHAADYLVANPDAVLDIVGHTCPIGTDTDNDKLGQRRAESVAAYLRRTGIDATRLRSTSAGERQVVRTDPAGYPWNRRAELEYLSDGSQPSDFDWMRQILNERFPGPPYPEIEAFVPHEVPGANNPQEDWQWGTLTSQMAEQIDTWVRENLKQTRAELDKDFPLPDWLRVASPLVAMAIKAAALAVLDKLIANPTQLIGELIGIPATNRSTPAPEPLVDCKTQPPT